MLLAISNVITLIALPFKECDQHSLQAKRSRYIQCTTEVSRRVLLSVVTINFRDYSMARTVDLRLSTMHVYQNRMPLFRSFLTILAVLVYVIFIYLLHDE
jgi:hypothetical protein